MGFISSLSSGYLQTALSSILGSGSTSSATGSSSAGASTGAQSATGNQQLSPFAQLLNTLQQLEQSNPSQYQQVTQQVGSNLQSAAQAAQGQGNSTAANQLNLLANDFTSASQSGKVPNLQDMLQAMGGGHGHHHHAAFQTGASQTDALNPMSIIGATLANAGVTGLTASAGVMG